MIAKVSWPWNPCAIEELTELYSLKSMLEIASLDQWFSTGSDFVPEGTFGNIWRHLVETFSCWN